MSAFPDGLQPTSDNHGASANKAAADVGRANYPTNAVVVSPEPKPRPKARVKPTIMESVGVLCSLIAMLVGMEGCGDGRVERAEEQAETRSASATNWISTVIARRWTTVVYPTSASYVHVTSSANIQWRQDVSSSPAATGNPSASSPASASRRATVFCPANTVGCPIF